MEKSWKIYEAPLLHRPTVSGIYRKIDKLSVQTSKLFCPFRNEAEIASLRNRLHLDFHPRDETFSYFLMVKMFHGDEPMRGSSVFRYFMDQETPRIEDDEIVQLNVFLAQDFNFVGILFLTENKKKSLPSFGPGSSYPFGRRCFPSIGWGYAHGKKLKF